MVRTDSLKVQEQTHEDQGWLDTMAGRLLFGYLTRAAHEKNGIAFMQRYKHERSGVLHCTTVSELGTGDRFNNESVAYHGFRGSTRNAPNGGLVECNPCSR
jgi:hypothetical protein